MAPRSLLLVDAGPFVAWYHRDDQAAAAMAAWLRRQDQRPEWRGLVTLDHAVDEAYNLLRRRAGPRSSEAFLEGLRGNPHLRVGQVDPQRVLARLRTMPRPARTRGITFTDVALAEFAAAEGVRCVLTFDRELAALGVRVVVPPG